MPNSTDGKPPGSGIVSDSQSGAPATRSGKPAFSASKMIGKLTGSAKGQFAIALDATGSMGPLIDSARSAIGQILQRVTQEAGQPVSVRIHVYRDYDCEGYTIAPLHEASELTADVHALEVWLMGRRPDGGGGNGGEAVEAALADILARGEADAVLLAGDEPAHDRANLTRLGKREIQTAADLANEFRARNIPIHAFVMGSDPRAKASLDGIAASSGGKSGRLDGGPEMIDLAVLAMLDRLKGAAGVRRYMEGRALSSNAKAFGDALLLPKPGDKT